ncbi:flagellar protein G [Thermogymnomonas acidicola]|uniref:Flagellar protein G n=1 Tax=Thermogymnomonas acidicola TaxID=399579 RepID=A0AA37BRA0_9ARCH|nr:flagellar protein G [Thermogymnomonas acidicola]GGM73479.1 flagellar protein G [Thermogymnomonas acidicola]
MASAATSELIFFIATLIISASVVGVLGAQTFHITSSIQESSRNTAGAIGTSFEIINQPDMIPYDNGYVFYIKNTGSTQFYFTNTTVSVVLNGTLLTGSEVTFSSPQPGYLAPGQVGEITVHLSLSPGYYTLSVTLSTGNSQELEFEV